MREVMMSVIKAGIRSSVPSCDIQEAESGGFPTIAVKVGRGASVSVPVVAFRAKTTIGYDWMSKQSRGWATGVLSKAIVRIAAEMARAVAGRRGGFSCACIDRSSVDASFEAVESGFQLRFVIGVASFPQSSDDDMVISTDRIEIDLGTFDIESVLPDECESMMEHMMAAIASSKELDEAVDALSDWADDEPLLEMP